MKRPLYYIALSIALTACAGGPPPSVTALTLTDGPVATLEPRWPLDRREMVTLLTPGPCERQVLGNWARQVHQTSILRGITPEERGVKVRAAEPITIAYNFYISDKQCTVVASTFLAPDRRYLVGGAREFSGKILPVSTGCSIEIIDAETNQPIPLLPGLVKPGYVQCAAPK